MAAAAGGTATRETAEPITGKPGATDTGTKPDAAADPGKEKPAGEEQQKPAADAAGDTGKKPEGKAGEEKPKPKAPEKYTLSMPEGANDWLDPTDLASVESLARSKDWTNEEAQAVLEEHADALAATSAAFRTTTEADEVYGGDNLAETQRFARLALDKVRPAGTPHGDALRRILAKTGYGNNLEVVSFLADLGKLMAEDRPGGGGTSDKAQPRDPAEVLYGKPTT